MCRIVGEIDFNKSNFQNITLIDDMRDTMSRGGPDDFGSWVDENDFCKMALGHRRLSIIDVSSQGHQPMVSDDGNIVISYNGEIYNYKELKDELIALGMKFKTNSDTEVIIQAYRKWGIGCLNKFIGMFSILLIDKNENTFYGIRDRAGVKPLYIYNHNGLFLFGSELKSFHKHPSFKKELNTSSLALYLQYGYVPAPHCIFKSTVKLLPGQYFKLNLETGESEYKSYWDLLKFFKEPSISDVGLPNLINETEKLLVSSCDYRMVSDVPVGVFLSGGYDSALVTAMLQKGQTNKIKTFCIGFEDSRFNEAPHAKKVADHLGTDHAEYYCKQQDAKDILPLLPDIYDEPFGDSSALPTILLSQFACQSVKVALSGDGGDEVFGGYERYSTIINLKEKISRFPKSASKFASVLINLMNPEFLFASTEKNNLSKRASNLSNILKSENMGDMLRFLMSDFTQEQIKNLVVQSYSEQETNFNKANVLGAGGDDINSLLAIDSITYLPDTILTKVDRATMSVGLEGREPLLDHRLLEWMAKIPGKYKINNGVKKYILKQIVNKYVPEALMDRPKMGFGVPIFSWFRLELRGYLDRYLDVKSLNKHNLLNVKMIQRMKNSYFNGNDQLIGKLWSLLMFQMWYERWID
jgi:asparagine synthase (glutamine-hydrolysing)